MKTKNDFLKSLLKEVDIQKDYLDGEVIDSVYFGGGTPSLLTMDEIQTVMSSLIKVFNIDENAEITLEANPDDVSVEKSKQWRKAEINRLSIGIQSFFDADLLWMNRIHTAQQAYASITNARDSGFENLSIDLIYGTPTLPDENWIRNLDLAIELDIPHLSCYSLTVENKTALESMIRLNPGNNIDPDTQARQFDIMTNKLESNGYEHYEISNFAKPGKRSRHNSAYWKQKKYLGLGPSAHSYNGKSRQWNVSNNSLYIQSLQQDVLPAEVEILSDVQKVNEYIMTSLRTKEGIGVGYLEENVRKELKKNTRRFIEQDLLKEENGHLQLTRNGKLFADMITSELFFDKI